MYSIGVDIGGSHIAACVYDHSVRALQERSLVYRNVDTALSRDEIIGEWTATIAACREKIDVDVRGVGIAMPGPFDYSGGISRISGVGKFDDLYGLNVRMALAEKLNFPPSQVRFINDATAFSIAEAMIGRASGCRRVVAITLGTGFGSSFLVEGKPVIESDHVPDGGFLYNQHYENDVADDVFSTRGLKAQYRALSGNEIADVKTLCEMAAHDDYAKRTFEVFGKNLGRFLKPYLSGFSAEALVVGGNIAKAFPHFGTTLTQQLGAIDIYVSPHAEYAAIIGGALLLDDTYYCSITETIRLMSTS